MVYLFAAVTIVISAGAAHISNETSAEQFEPQRERAGPSKLLPVAGSDVD
jgi:hypothetical protein